MRHGYLIDMDGVLCRGREPIPGAAEFISALRDANIPFLVLTNNSQRSRRDIATQLQRVGIPVTEGHIYTSAMATARFLARIKPNGTAYVIGEGGLTTALHHNGFAIVDQSPDFVVIGEGRTVTFEQLEQAVRLVAHGARLIATNLDPNCPTEFGLRPGCGAIVAMLEVATGKKAFSVGKPSPVMLRAARKELGLRTDETAIIGDTMNTDIWGGVQLGYHTILVLSGSTQLPELEHYAYCPDRIIPSVAELVTPLRQHPDRPLWIAQEGNGKSPSPPAIAKGQSRSQAAGRSPRARRPGTVTEGGRL